MTEPTSGAPTLIHQRDHMPFTWWYPVLAGAVATFIARLVFSGDSGNRYSAMLGAFIYLVPVLCGAVTVYIAERQMRRSWWYYIWAPFVASVLAIIGMLLVFIEGLVCAILIVPLFGALGAAGGLAMGVICRITNWPKPALYSFAVLPLMLGAIEPQLPNPDRLSSTTRTVFIAAPPERVWQEVNAARNIRPAEVGDAWAYRMGVPMPEEGVTEQTSEGLVRKMRWQKNVHFDAVVTEWAPGQHVKWRYRFAPDSFPKGSLDDHVVVGGRYFDLRDSAYTLTPRGGGTELRIDVSWRVSTRFNWYADGIAQFLLGDFSNHILQFFKVRSEAASA